MSARLSEMGAELLRAELARCVAGELTPRPQDDSLATMAPLLSKAHGRINWSQSAEAVHNQIRGMNPWPGAHTRLDGRHIKVHRALPSTLDPEGAEPGQVTALDPEGILVACARGTLEIQELQESGRRRVDARAFISGRRIALGDRFSSEGANE